MSAEATVHFSTVMNDLRQKRLALTIQIEAIDNAIKGLELVYRPSAETTTGNVTIPVPSSGLRAVGLPSTPLMQYAQQMTVAEVAAAYLGGENAPRKTEEIVVAVQSAGLLADSQSPSNAIFSSLSRKPDTFSRVGRGLWALTKWNLVPGSQEGS